MFGANFIPNHMAARADQGAGLVWKLSSRSRNLISLPVFGRRAVHENRLQSGLRERFTSEMSDSKRIEAIVETAANSSPDQLWSKHNYGIKIGVSLKGRLRAILGHFVLAGCSLCLVRGSFCRVVADNQPGKKNRMHSELVTLADSVRQLMRCSLPESGEGDSPFEQLAMDLYAAQRRLNPAYARFCEQRNVGSVAHWTEIPAVPTSAFKQLELTSIPVAQRMSVFYSSGTTQQERSRHFHSDESLALYEESLWNRFATKFGAKEREVSWLFLTPQPEQAPNSSLAHMFGAIARRQKKSEFMFVGNVGSDGEWMLDTERVVGSLKSAEAKGQRVAVLGTAFQFVHLIDSLQGKGERIRLAGNSWAMETGGYKGRSREVAKEALHRMIGGRLGIAPDQIYGEYGMSELSSQAYAGADGVFRFPPWARARIISPINGKEAGQGERGLIRVYDLANVWSVMAVQTEDVGIKEGNGFRLLGRAVAAEARGCSLMTV
jgi:hypothetical protein